ncbi:MAG: hypothetical protein HUU01_18505 [Saprospiraceae bacterium]|nr:hypothetical protein [Saprospiraceae bacterium]
MNNLTEHNIKLASLRYLKEYYKFRPRSGETKISTDMRAEGGIVADGYLTFLKEDENPFVATLEATSFSTKNEVRFQLKQEKLAWDCAAIALSFMAILMFISHNLSFYAALQLGLLISMAIFASVVSLFFLLFWFLLSRMRRYRFIYAIEQFKEYEADEQWIAIGEDVFPSYSDRYFLELQRQCIHFGFGLLVVNEALRPRMLITPARQQVFVGRRRLLSFISLGELGKRLSESRYTTWARKYTSPGFSEARRFITPYQSTFSYHRRRYPHQMSIIAICLISMAALFINEWGKRPIRVLDQEAYSTEMEAKAKTNKREAFGFDVDTASVRPFNTNVKPYIVMGPGARQDGNEELILSVDFDDNLTYYDCSRLSFKTAKYIVQDTMVRTADLAVRRIYDLKGLGIKANALWLGCFGKDTRYVVFPGLLHTSHADAEASRIVFEKAYKKVNANNQLRIKSLTINK